MLSSLTKFVVDTITAWPPSKHKTAHARAHTITHNPLQQMAESILPFLHFPFPHPLTIIYISHRTKLAALNVSALSHVYGKPGRQILTIFASNPSDLSSKHHPPCLIFITLFIALLLLPWFISCSKFIYFTGFFPLRDGERKSIFIICVRDRGRSSFLLAEGAGHRFF